MKTKLIQLFIFGIFLSLIINPLLVTTTISEAVNTFINVLFPSIFPFFLISDLLINYNFDKILSRIFSKINSFLFHTSTSSDFVIIMSLLSGFPSGAKYIKTLLDKNRLSINQANYLITFTHFSNPFFVFTITSIIFHNSKITSYILFSHIISNFIIAFICRPKKKEETIPISYKDIDSFSNILSTSIISSLKLLAIILGNTCFFFVLIELIFKYFNFNIICKIFISGFFDITKGITYLKAITGNYTLFKAIIITSFISFGGINVHMQVASILKDTKVKYKNFLLGRVCQVAMSSFILLIIYFLNA